MPNPIAIALLFNKELF